MDLTRTQLFIKYTLLNVTLHICEPLNVTNKFLHLELKFENVCNIIIKSSKKVILPQDAYVM